MPLSSDICQKLACIKEQVMASWAKETGPEEAIARWQVFVRELPKDTPFDQLPKDVQEFIQQWQKI